MMLQTGRKQDITHVLMECENQIFQKPKDSEHIKKSPANSWIEWQFVRLQMHWQTLDS